MNVAKCTLLEVTESPNSVQGIHGFICKEFFSKDPYSGEDTEEKKLYFNDIKTIWMSIIN